MCAKHDALDFIGRRLQEAVEQGEISQFTANQVWAQVKKCHAPEEHHWQSETSIKCLGCADYVYPCRKVKETASAWQEHPEFNEEWKSVV